VTQALSQHACCDTGIQTGCTVIDRMKICAWTHNTNIQVGYGPADVGENEGLGGLLKVVQQDPQEVKTVVHEIDREELANANAQRQRLISDRSDPRLQALDIFALECEERTAKGELIVYEWRLAIQKAELIYLDDPDQMQSFMKRMRIESSSRTEKLKSLNALAHKLEREAIIAIPPLVWQSAMDREEHEDRLVCQLGFIFLAYRVEFWYWESLEMVRKFLMTCVLVFLQLYGPAQLATGAMITFAFLLINLVYRPFCTGGLNSLQNFSLISQFITLFVGLLIGYTDAKDELDGGDMNNKKAEKMALTALIIMSNSFVCAWPIVRKLKTGGFLGYYQTGIWLLNIPMRCFNKKGASNDDTAFGNDLTNSQSTALPKNNETMLVSTLAQMRSIQSASPTVQTTEKEHENVQDISSQRRTGPMLPGQDNAALDYSKSLQEQIAPQGSGSYPPLLPRIPVWLHIPPTLVLESQDDPEQQADTATRSLARHVPHTCSLDEIQVEDR